MPATETLLAKAAERIGALQLSEDWLQLQLTETQQALAAVTLDRDQMHTLYAELRTERDQLAARLKELEPPPMTGPTPKPRPHRKRPSRAGLK